MNIFVSCTQTGALEPLCLRRTRKKPSSVELSLKPSWPGNAPITYTTNSSRIGIVGGNYVCASASDNSMGSAGRTAMVTTDSRWGSEVPELHSGGMQRLMVESSSPCPCSLCWTAAAGHF